MRLITEQLAGFVSNVRYEHLSDEVIEKSERAILDTLAALIGGVPTDNTRLSRVAAKACFGSGGAHAWFAEGGLHYLGAVFANCAAASSLDVDDGHCLAAGHPGAAIVPAILMEAAKLGSDGHEVLTATAIGYDVALRIAAARRFSETMSFASGQWTGFGVAAAIGWLRKMHTDQLAHALAIAGAESPQNLPQGDCQASSVKGSSPWSTVAALFSVERASCGMSGSIDMLDRAHAYNVGAITADLGSRWLICETYLKPYASCRYTHPVIDAVLALVAGRGTDEPIGRMAVDIFPEARKLPNEYAPKSLEGGQFSVPFAAALAALRGAEAFRPLRPHSLSDPQVVELAQRVEVRYPDEFAGTFPQRTPARVTMVVGGHERTADVPRPLGDAKNQMDQSPSRRSSTTSGRTSFRKPNSANSSNRWPCSRWGNSHRCSHVLPPSQLQSAPLPDPTGWIAARPSGTPVDRLSKSPEAHSESHGGIP
ncbi:MULTISPECIES: MmgE/PrpD family protein [unclassified Mesorhizobium]|uniref:MmgE/PrpD family protein n=1 Tax=unclassified Mesorhizobium TaxID=325217 RepID=UPI001CCF6746|nr:MULTISPECIES: MmgE/PrpD family protein [unclassified Mesorhizobium]MBZ9701675.1 MmgE/PrpD family protein [Mesorhizobium sp. CO1-1-3]MBZ9949023.1 MmgE/PrpD family protein [Mesorhizobium sp. BR1-1-11]